MTRSAPDPRLPALRLGHPLLALTALLLAPAVAGAQGMAPARRDVGNVTTGNVAGRVHAADGGPVAGARVAVAGRDIATTSDTAGAYLLPQLPAGVDTLEITRAGYTPLTLAVIVPEHGGVTVDLLLAATPVTLPAVRVMTLTAPAAPFLAARLDDAGEWSWHDGVVASAPGREPDVLHLLGAAPWTEARPDGTGTRFLGAGAGTPLTRITVDGIPIWTAAHAGGLLGGVAPDVVGEVRLFDGTSAARYGATGSGMLDVQTGEGTLQRPVWGAAITPVAMRAALGSPVQLGSVTGGMLVAARQSGAQTPLGAFTSRQFADPWSDLSGALSLQHGRSTLRVIGLLSSDRLRMDPDAFEMPGVADTSRSAPEDRTDGRVRLPWRTTTVGAVWTEERDAGELQLRGWRSTLAAMRDFPAAGSARTDTASSAGIALEGHWGDSHAGASIESISTAYAVAARTGSADSLQPRTLSRSLALRAAPTVLAAFAERRLHGADDGWVLTAGLRASALAGTAPVLDPRLALAVRLPRDSRFTLGYARAHEYVQSLWSGSPALDALMPVALQVAARPGVIPALGSDLLTATVATQVRSDVRVGLSGFVRSFNSLLVAADPGRDSARGRFTVTDSRTSGASLTASGALGAATWATSYAVTRVNATVPLADLGARRSTAQDLSAMLMLPFRATDLRLAGWLGSPQLAPVGDSFDPGSSRDGDRDADAGRGALVRDERAVTGSAVGGARPFPPYFRLDLTAAHHWRVGARGELDGSLTLANALGHPNLALPLIDPGEGGHALDLTPRSLIAGLSWRVR